MSIPRDGAKSSSFDPHGFVEAEEASLDFEAFRDSFKLNPATLAPLATVLLPLQSAYAKGGEYGIFEGRTASLMHPITMAALFFTSLYSGYLGLQWRRLRTLGDDIKELNAQLPKLSTYAKPVRYPLKDIMTSISTEIAGADADTDAAKVAGLKNDLSLLQGAMTIDGQIGDLTATRRELAAKDLK